MISLYTYANDVFWKYFNFQVHESQAVRHEVSDFKTHAAYVDEYILLFERFRAFFLRFVSSFEY